MAFWVIPGPIAILHIQIVGAPQGFQGFHMDDRSEETLDYTQTSSHSSCCA